MVSTSWIWALPQHHSRNIWYYHHSMNHYLKISPVLGATYTCIYLLHKALVLVPRSPYIFVTVCTWPLTFVSVGSKIMRVHVLLAWMEGQLIHITCIIYPSITATSLQYGTDIRVFLNETELKTLLVVNISNSSSPKISDYFTQHPNQTQAVSDQCSGTPYSAHPEMRTPWRTGDISLSWAVCLCTIQPGHLSY